MNRFANIIEKEISYHRDEVEFPSFEFSTKFDTENMDDKRIEKVEYYLNQLKKHLNHKFTELSKERDVLIYSVEKTNDQPSYFNSLKEKYVNQSVTSAVTLENRINKVILVEDDLIQRGDPIFRDATNFRAHFYAPKKRLGNLLFDTFWYKKVVIWLFSIVMMITLQFDIFHKILELLNRK